MKKDLIDFINNRRNKYNDLAKDCAIDAIREIDNKNLLINAAQIVKTADVLSSACDDIINCVNKNWPVEHTVKEHLYCPEPFNNSKWKMATVLNGPHKDKTVCLLVEFSDGNCLCDLGSDSGNTEDFNTAVIHIKNLRLWISVDSITVKE